jgi:hypothetical protein
MASQQRATLSLVYLIAALKGARPAQEAICRYAESMSTTLFPLFTNTNESWQARISAPPVIVHVSAIVIRQSTSLSIELARTERRAKIVRPNSRSVS